MATDVTAKQAWDAMGPGWRQAYGQAWASYAAGSLGIGAALVDPEDGSVVASGRNRVNDSTAEPRSLSGNFMAHAEMNAFAAMDRFKADGLHLYTTLQPCLMCAASAVFLHVDSVFFAAADEYFPGLDDLWDHHPYSVRWKPTEIGPLDPALAAFARVLPLTVEQTSSPTSPVLATAKEKIPVVAALAGELAIEGTLIAIANRGGSVLDALDELWPTLPR